jgi:hypothetical protein
MKLIHTIFALSLIVNMPLCYAVDDYDINVQSATGYKIPKQLLKDLTTTVTNNINDSVPGWVEQGSQASTVFLSHFTHNITCICSGTVVGAIGAYLACKGISRYFDPAKNQEPQHTNSHLKLTALGIAIMAGAGLTVNALLK